MIQGSSDWILHFTSSNEKIFFQSSFMLIDGPAVLLRLGHERVAERADLRLRAVGELAHCVVVMHQHHQPRAAAGLRPLQHLLIAVRVAERGDGPAADVLS